MICLLPSVTLAADTWQKLAPVPDAVGFAAPFAGVHNGALIVAGGANFPDRLPWQGGTKVWHDRIFVLTEPHGKWLEAGRLPIPLGYGVSIVTENGLVCIGGSDAEKHSSHVFLLRWENGEIIHQPLPPLPQPCANACGAMLEDVLYVAGGLESPTDTTTLKTFWALDLTQHAPQWQTLEPWPGQGRMLATAGVLNGEFYLMGGCDLKAAADGKAERLWLKDAYAYRPGAAQGWRKLAQLPRPSVAAPTPATSLAENKLVIFGGDDGSQLNTEPDRHPGFPRQPLTYDATKDQWSLASPEQQMPFSLVTTSAVTWHGMQIIPGGEARPGIRSTEVWALPMPDTAANFSTP